MKGKLIVIEENDSSGKETQSKLLNLDYIKHIEEAYLQMKDMYGFKYIPCVEDGALRSIENISEDVFKFAKEIIDGK